jgi:hypothetical protein
VNIDVQLLGDYTSFLLSERITVRLVFLRFLSALDGREETDIMRSMCVRLSQVAVVFGACLLLAGFCTGQDRFDSGRYKGFTKYSAFAIIELQEPFTVREAKDIIQYPNGMVFSRVYLWNCETQPARLRLQRLIHKDGSSFTVSEKALICLRQLYPGFNQLSEPLYSKERQEV